MDTLSAATTTYPVTLTFNPSTISAPPAGVAHNKLTISNNYRFSVTITGCQFWYKPQHSSTYTKGTCRDKGPNILPGKSVIQSWETQVGPGTKAGTLDIKVYMELTVNGGAKGLSDPGYYKLIVT